MNNFLNGMFGKVGNGMCRLSMNGDIAVKTSTGYKTYNVKTGKLTNCNNFVFDIGEEFFFVIPTNKVEKGDIILVNGKPKCVIEADKNKITVVNYEDSAVDMILPERHVFMGNTYFYGKIVSMFGNDMFKSKKGTNNIFKYMMLSQMMNGNDGTNGSMAFGNMSAMLPFMMMGGGNGMSEMFDGMFDFDVDDESLMYDFVHDVIIFSGIPLSDIQAYKTPHGYAIVVPHGFDTRELIEKWKDYDITLKRDKSLFLDMITKE